jgi:SAM-dependent methyltransferase
MTTQIDSQVLEQFMGKVVSDLAASYSGVLVSVGDKLGLYKLLENAGPLSSAELAQRSDCDERYVREWLNSQAAAGYIHYHASSGTYELMPEQAAVFADRESPVFFPPAWQVPASMWFDEDKTLEAFRTGKGVPWGEHDERLFCGVAAFFRNGYRANLVENWLPALDGVKEKLEQGATVIDVGCGYGHSTEFMALAFPRSRFIGIDTHAGSLEAARANAAAAGVGDRVRFECARAIDFDVRGADLICFFDCLHDMGHPDAAARHALEALAADGTVLLVEPYADDRVEHNLNPVGQIYYAASTTLCCAHARSEKGTHALGAQAGMARLEGLFRQAGFSRFRLATQTPFNLIIEARP